MYLHHKLVFSIKFNYRKIKKGPYFFKNNNHKIINPLLFFKKKHY